jgi:hypothetical protein
VASDRRGSVERTSGAIARAVAHRGVSDLLAADDHSAASHLSTPDDASVAALPTAAAGAVEESTPVHSGAFATHGIVT